MTALANDMILEHKIFTYKAPQVAVNVMHWKVTALAIGMSDQEAVNSLDALVAPQYIGCLSANATYYGSQLSVVYPGPREDVVQTSSSLSVGSQSGDDMPSQTCGIITKRSGTAGRANRGRFYVAFPTEACNSAAGIPESAYITSMGALTTIICASQSITNGVGTCTLVPVIFHRLSPSTPTTITNGRVNAKWATQRRRGAYGRPNAIPPF